MIDLSCAPLSLRGVTVLRDHADPDLFYYLPGVPKLVLDAQGMAFTLYKWRRDLSDNPNLEPDQARGAGLALFETSCALAEGVQAGLVAEIGATVGRPDARLVPAPFRRGHVRTIVASGEGMTTDLLLTELAPLFAPWQAAFSLGLSAEGAGLFQRALEGERLPIGVAYEWELDGLLPALHADVTMDYERIYRSFEASVGFQFTYGITWRAELDLVIKKLMEEDAIKVEIIAFQDTEDQRRQQEQVMDLIRARVESGFFRTAIPKEAQSSSGLLGALIGTSGSISSSSGMFVLKARYEMQDELKVSHMQIRGRSAVALMHVSTGILSAMLGEDERSPVRISEIDTDDPWLRRLVVGVRSAVSFDAMPDLVAVTAQIEHQGRVDSFAFERASAGAAYTFEAWLDAPDQDRYTLEVQYDFDRSSGSGPAQIRVAPVSTRQRQLVLNPLAHLRYRHLELLLGPGAESARVLLRVPGAEGQEDLGQADLVLDTSAPAARWSVRAPRSAPPLEILAKTEWTGADGLRFDSGWTPVEGESLVVLGPFEDVLRLHVEPSVDWSANTLLLVAVRYEDGEHTVDRELRFEAATARGQAVEIPLRDSRRRAYRWRQVLYPSVGPPRETAWLDADSPILVVGVMASETAKLSVRLLGGFGAALGVIVDLWATDPRTGQEEKQSLFFRPPTLDAEATMPLDEGELRYRFEARRLLEAGEELIARGERETAILLVRI